MSTTDSRSHLVASHVLKKEHACSQYKPNTSVLIRDTNSVTYN